MLKQFVEQIRFLENQIDELDEKISESLTELDSPITTITGIGDTLVAAILSEIGDIERFESADKLAAFAGIDPSVSQSGIFWVQGTECQSVVPRTSDVPSGLLLPQPFFTIPLSKRFTTVKRLRASTTMSALATSAVSSSTSFSPSSNPVSLISLFFLKTWIRVLTFYSWSFF